MYRLVPPISQDSRAFPHISRYQRLPLCKSSSTPSEGQKKTTQYGRKEPMPHHRFSNTLGSIVMTMTRLEIISMKATSVIKKTEPLLAGNLPRMIQYCVLISAFCPVLPFSLPAALSYSRFSKASPMNIPGSQSTSSLQ